MDYKAHRDTGRARARKMMGAEPAIKAVHEHEDHMHKGEKKTKIKLKNGGVSRGTKVAARMDKAVRGPKANSMRPPFKNGGATKKHSKSPHTKVNVIVAGGGQQPPIGMPPRPMPPAAGAMPPGMPPRPPMAPPQGMPPGGMPPGAPPPGAGMPMKPPGMMNAGGAVNTKIKAPKMKFGAGGGKGRIEKGPKYGAKPLACGGKTMKEPESEE